jgi:NADPH-dependent 2,4-dienoyl-CoA reductase/sulfur reductase-like enzyme
MSVQSSFDQASRVRHGDIRSIDLASRRVAFDGESLAYDYLIVALGAELAPDAIPGLFYTLAGATRLRSGEPPQVIVRGRHDKLSDLYIAHLANGCTRGVHGDHGSS